MIAPPFDDGVQNERTRLAWQRTILSGLACSLLVARLLAPELLIWSLLIALGAVLNSALVSWFTVRRYGANQAALYAARPVGDGRAQVAVTALVVVTAAGALAYVLTR